MASPLVNVSNLNVFHGDAQALWDVDFQINEGEVFSIIGYNGSGKSTILRTLSGLLRPASGEVKFEGIRIDGKSPMSIVDAGISLVPEGRGLFASMTVLENLELGAFTRRSRLRKEESMKWVFGLFPPDYDPTEPTCRQDERR